MIRNNKPCFQLKVEQCKFEGFESNKISEDNIASQATDAMSNQEISLVNEGEEINECFMRTKIGDLKHRLIIITEGKLKVCQNSTDKIFLTF